MKNTIASFVNRSRAIKSVPAMLLVLSGAAYADVASVHLLCTTNATGADGKNETFALNIESNENRFSSSGAAVLGAANGTWKADPSGTALFPALRKESVRMNGFWPSKATEGEAASNNRADTTGKMFRCQVESIIKGAWPF